MYDSLTRPEATYTVATTLPAYQDRTGPSEIECTILLKSIFDQNPRQGLELIFIRYYSALCSHAARFVYSRHIAEDLVSDLFLKFYRTKAYDNITSSYGSYLFRSVRNECFTYLSEECRKTDTLGAAEEATIPGYDQQPDAEMDYNNLVVKVNEAIGQLPKKCRKVFLLSRFENMKYYEIANELNISPKTVEVHISKALRSLRSALRAE